MRRSAGSLLIARKGPEIRKIESQEEKRAHIVAMIWLPPRDSNPDMLIQSQLSYH